MPIQVHIAHPDYKEHLRNELDCIIEEHDTFIIAKAQSTLPVFALDSWLDPQIISIDPSLMQRDNYNHTVNFGRLIVVY